MLRSFADQLIVQLEADYNRIAGHFAQTRFEAWPEFGSLKTLIQNREDAEHTELLDIGCGNGRLAAAIPVVHYTGLDLSSQLLKIAKKQYPQHHFIQSSMLQLPFPNQSFDIVACVAALQHIPSAAYRLQALQEMQRVLKPGGTVFMMNWNLAEQNNYQRYIVAIDQGYDADDYLIPWKNDQGEIQAQRYYHGFRIAELAELCKNTELQIVKNELSQDKRNIVTLAKRA